MTSATTRIAAAAMLLACTATANAKYPVLSHIARHADGPYQPETRRYVVVDPAASPAGHGIPAGAHGVGPHAAHASTATQMAPEVWRRHDLATPVYPYGWFGARPANSRWTRGSYYDDYENVTIFRGR